MYTQTISMPLRVIGAMGGLYLYEPEKISSSIFALPNLYTYWCFLCSIVLLPLESILGYEYILGMNPPSISAVNQPKVLLVALMWLICGLTGTAASYM